MTGDRFELKSNKNVNNEACSKASFLYRASYTQQNNKIPTMAYIQSRQINYLNSPTIS